MLRTVLAWAIRVEIRKLPPEFVNPVSQDVIGKKPVKNPLREVKAPMKDRIRMVEAMDRWQLLHLSILMVLPLRFEDVAGALVSDVDFEKCMLALGTRLDGNDFNKARLDVLMPIPEELIPILRVCAAGRPDGPLFRTRAVWEARRQARLAASSRDEIEQMFQRELEDDPAGTVQTEQDRKLVFRQQLRKMGGISEDHIGKELKGLLKPGVKVRPYDIRGSVSQDMKASGMQHLELRYLTEHAVNDILNEYVSLDPVGEMARYFDHCRPVLQAIADRARALGIRGN